MLELIHDFEVHFQCSPTTTISFTLGKGEYKKYVQVAIAPNKSFNFLNYNSFNNAINPKTLEESIKEKDLDTNYFIMSTNNDENMAYAIIIATIMIQNGIPYQYAPIPAHYHLDIYSQPPFRREISLISKLGGPEIIARKHLSQFVSTSALSLSNRKEIFHGSELALKNFLKSFVPTPNTFFAIGRSTKTNDFVIYSNNTLKT